MVSSRGLLVFLFVLIPAAGLASQAKPSVIYGEDNRRDLYQVEQAAVRALADSTVALFDDNRVTIDPQRGIATLAGSKYGTANGLCKNEPFYDQPAGAFCSGSLVAPDIVMTAGHCIESQGGCRRTRFVFGFALERAEGFEGTVRADDVYECAELLGRRQVNDGADWALVRLTRPVTGHQPLALNRGGAVERGASLVVIGHPSGLPAKVADGATVRDETKPGYFVANLDTYGGNSGSAVFNAETGLVEGILVRGETDFVYDTKKKCRKSNICASDECRGEDVTKIAEVLELLDKSTGAKR
ncbi:MAG: serine protease [Oligoflexia bacterium]|nr:serine protease [Oligoflexia bacterium]